MSAYDDLLTAMQEMATDEHHACANDGYRGESYEFPPDEVHERLSVHLKAVLEELAVRMEALGQREIDGGEHTGLDRMRALTWFVAAEEIRTFAEDDFTVDSSTEEVVHEVYDSIEEFFTALDAHNATTALTPDYAYHRETGTVVPLSARAKYETRPAEGYRHTQWAFGSYTMDRHSGSLGERLEFGSNVYARRKELGYSRKKLARQVGQSKELIKAIEYGEYAFDCGAPLSRQSLLVEQLANVLETTVDTLWPITGQTSE
jgi:hypothetical protein